MQIIHKAAEWQTAMRQEKKLGKSIGFVPTMGALHEGHLSLIRKARSENTLTVVSIFVNPTQFNDPADFAKYPMTWDADRALLEELAVDYVFFPVKEDLYQDGYTYKVSESQLSLHYCGASRPGHFDGVLTIVLKLLLLTIADKAYFGEKDWQQFLLIHGMVKAFFIETEIIPCPLIREASGLALSSRNLLLDPRNSALAPEFYRVLSSGKPIAEMKEILSELGFKVDYIEQISHAVFGSRLLGAVYLGTVRLIDNVPLPSTTGKEIK